MDQLTIAKVGRNAYTVADDDGKHACGLTMDEALGTIASWIYTGRTQFGMVEVGAEGHECYVPAVVSTEPCHEPACPIDDQHAHLVLEVGQ